MHSTAVGSESSGFHHVPHRPQLISKPVKTATLITGEQHTIQCVFNGRSVILYSFGFTSGFLRPIGFSYRISKNRI